MTSPEVIQLRALARDAFEAGKLEEALKCYLELESLDPDPEWAAGAAAVFERLGRKREQINALLRSANALAELGEILKAAALCKRILAIEPGHPETMRRIQALRAAHGAQQRGEARPVTQPPVARAPARPSSWIHRPHAGLETMRLKETMPGAARDAGFASGVYHIPLEDEVSDEVPITRGTSPPRAGTLPSGGLAAGGPGPERRATVPPLGMGAPRAVEALELDQHGNLVPVRSTGSEPAASGPAEPATVAEASPPGALLAQLARTPSGTNFTLPPTSVPAAPATPEDDADDPLLAAVADEVRVAERANDALMSMPIFSDLSAKTFGDLILHARLVQLERHQQLFRQGDPGDALYVIASGAIGVIDEGPPRRGLAKLGEGDLFGEIALVTDLPRTATCTALAPTDLIAIDRSVIHKLVASDPQFLGVLLRFLRDRLVQRLFATNPLFTGLSEADRGEIRRRFRVLEVEPGATMIEQGKEPPGLLVMLGGQARAVRSEDGVERPLGVLRAGDVAGEMSLLTGSAAIATVQTTTKALVVVLPAPIFLAIVRARPEAASFIDGIVERRRQQVNAIAAGSGPYAEGRLNGV